VRPRIAALVPLVVALAACGTARPAAAPPPNVAAALAANHACRAGELRPLGSRRLAYAAVVRSHAHAFRAPGRRPFAMFGRLNANGVPTVFGILGAVVGPRCAPVWYHVELPLRPNGATGFVRARAVDVATVKTRIVVDVSARRVVLLRNGRRVLAATAAVGAPATPTPIGRYYVNQRLIPEDTSGPFGPGAIGISAFSNVLTGWTQGGPIAIHGTNEPWSIGHPVSNGCIRVPNAVLRRLFAATLAGTPVVIHA
jgi:lipoprotein-anchoring transpeptidase ErfK/SrfK